MAKSVMSAKQLYVRLVSGLFVCWVTSLVAVGAACVGLNCSLSLMIPLATSFVALVAVATLVVQSVMLFLDGVARLNAADKAEGSSADTTVIHRSDLLMAMRLPMREAGPDEIEDDTLSLPWVEDDDRQ